MNIYFCMFFLGALLCWMPINAREADDQLVRVGSYEHEVRGLKAYTFVYENIAAEGTTAGFSVGYDYHSGEFEHDCSGDGYPVELISPPGWSAQIFTTEESTGCQIRWKPNNSALWLKAGQAKTGFTVLLKQESKVLGPYGLGHWTVFAYKYGALTGKMRLASGFELSGQSDTTPPTITVTPSISEIWPPNNQMVDINMQVTVADDRDSSPAVRLISVDCNECETADNIKRAELGADDRSVRVRAARTGQGKEGRVYTFIYDATDESGNSSAASVTVTVPHDKR